MQLPAPVLEQFSKTDFKGMLFLWSIFAQTDQQARQAIQSQKSLMIPFRNILFNPLLLQ